MNMSKWLKKSVEVCSSLIFCLLVPSWVHAQSLQAVASVAVGRGSAGTTFLCQDVVNNTSGQMAVTGTCQGSWSDGTGSGSCSGTVVAAYGSVRSAGNASETVVTASSDGTQTQTSLGGSFQDTMTFPTLTTNAFLRAILTVQGSLSGDPTSYISSIVSMTVNGTTG